MGSIKAIFRRSFSGFFVGKTKPGPRKHTQQHEKISSTQSSQRKTGTSGQTNHEQRSTDNEQLFSKERQLSTSQTARERQVTSKGNYRKYQSTRYSQLSTFGLTFQIYEMYEKAHCDMPINGHLGNTLLMPEVMFIKI